MHAPPRAPLLAEMRILLAFDKFKEALAAPAACAVAHTALRESHPDWSFDLCPLSDGGDGFAEILTAAAGGRLEPKCVTGPLGDPISAPVGLVPLSRLPPTIRRRLIPSAPATSAATLAVLDLASASGLALVAPAERNLLLATTGGTGALLAAAAHHQPAAILLGVGGSATNDLGLGALTALGLRAETAAGQPVAPPAPRHWPAIVRFRGQPAPLPPLYVACDVTNPLLGPTGCAAIFGPQKGLLAADLAGLERDSDRLARLLCAHTGRSTDLIHAAGAGAAGGIAFGLMAGAGAELVPGFELVAEWLELDRRIAAADLVITGEGRFDATSAAGKGPGAIVARAAAAGKPVHVFAGRVDEPHEGVHAITPPGWPLTRALPATAERLRATLRAVLG